MGYPIGCARYCFTVSQYTKVAGGTPSLQLGREVSFRGSDRTPPTFIVVVLHSLVFVEEREGIGIRLVGLGVCSDKGTR